MRKLGRQILICDCCGKEVVLDLDKEDEWTLEIKSKEIIHISIPDKGYGSIYDRCNIEMDVCEDCLKDWIKTFKHNPVRCLD